MSSDVSEMEEWAVEVVTEVADAAARAALKYGDPVLAGCVGRARQFLAEEMEYQYWENYVDPLPVDYWET